MSIPPSLDSLDRKILLELDRDARQPLSTLAKKVRVGRDIVNYRVDRLREHGVLRKCTAIINPYKLGFTLYKTYLRLGSGKQRRTAFLNYVWAQPRTYWGAECHGRCDLILSNFARNGKEFHEMHTDVISQFNDIVLGVEVYELVDLIIFQKSYLRRQDGALWIVGGVPTTEDLDYLELSLIEMLFSDARLSYAELAERLDSTPAIVKYRLEKLEKLGVILGYRTDLDLEQLGMMCVKMQLQLRSHHTSFDRQLLDYAQRHPNITYYIRQIGQISVEFEIEIADFDEYYQLVDDLRERFPDLIEHIDYILLRKERFRWKPHDLLASTS